MTASTSGERLRLTAARAGMPQARQWADRSVAEDTAGHLFVGIPGPWAEEESDEDPARHLTTT